MLLFCPAVLSGAELRSDTVKAWDEYVRAAESHVRASAERGVLWIDEEPGLRERVKGGEVAARPVGGESRTVPRGLIHDWVGTVFIPKVSPEDVFAIVQNYDNYAHYYGPTVRNAKLLSQGDGTRTFRVQYVRKALFTTVALNTEYEVRSVRIDERHWYSVGRSTSIRQIQNYGEKREHELPPDQGSGYMWRAANLVQIEARDGGVYLEQEDMGLSRNIPAGWHWLVAPFVEHLSRELITGWLAQTRNAVNAAVAARHTEAELRQ